jgi:thymidylate synthase
MSIWSPRIVEAPSFQLAWINAARLILDNGREMRNLVVSISDINAFNPSIHQAFEKFCRVNGLLAPKDVAYTIFPQGLTRTGRNANDLFKIYNKPGGLFDRIKTGWGTYFRRMTHYNSARNNDYINQLNKIIEALRTRRNVATSAYTMVIQEPGSETTRPLGGPCLNYIALQIDAGPPKRIGLLAVYRNHDFLKKTYGNYLGLIQLLKFICRETGYDEGPLTCMSSHAYIDDHIGAFRTLLSGII